MKKEKIEETECCQGKFMNKGHHHDCHCYGQTQVGSGAIYGMGVIGALFYFLQNATSFGLVMVGIGKAIFWPAILMFELLSYLGM